MSAIAETCIAGEAVEIPGALPHSRALNWLVHMPLRITSYGMQAT